MEKFWVDNVFYLIKGYSNLAEQHKAWLGLDKSIVSSYNEDMAMLFDDNDFNSFIEEWEAEKLDKKVLTELMKFRDKLNEYDKKIPKDNSWHDKQILNDPEWLDVVEQAKRILQIWKIK